MQHQILFRGIRSDKKTIQIWSLTQILNKMICLTQILGNSFLEGSLRCKNMMTILKGLAFYLLMHNLYLIRESHPSKG